MKVAHLQTKAAKLSLAPKSLTDPTAWVSDSFKCEPGQSAAVNQQARERPASHSGKYETYNNYGITKPSQEFVREFNFSEMISDEK